MPTFLLHPITILITGGAPQLLDGLAGEVVSRMPGSWLPTAALVDGNRTVRACWPALTDPEPHDVRRISDLLAARLADGQGVGPRWMVEPVVVGVSGHTPEAAARVAEVAVRLGAEVFPDRPAAVDEELPLTVVWPTGGELAAMETLAAVAEFLRRTA
jgi:hypothetical protein